MEPIPILLGSRSLSDVPSGAESGKPVEGMDRAPPQPPISREEYEHFTEPLNHYREVSRQEIDLRTIRSEGRVRDEFGGHGAKSRRHCAFGSPATHEWVRAGLHRPTVPQALTKDFPMKPLLLFVALCLFCPTVALAEAVTAEWNLEVDMNSYAGFGVRALAWKRGQTFVAETTGTLDSASFRLYRNYEQLTPDLRFEVYAVGGDGLPTGPALHSEDFPTAHVAHGQPALPYTFAFTGTPPELEQGFAYAMVLTAVEPEGGALFTLNGFSNPRNDYSAGSSVNQAWGETGWTFIGGDADFVDFGFRITVEPLVPTEAMSWGQMKGQYQRP